MGVQYRKPPFREAVCQVVFDPKGPWDEAIPGLVSNQLHSDFPIRKQATDDGILLSLPSRGKPRAVPRLRLYDKEETSALQIGKHSLAVNQLQPYPSWEVFRPKIEQAIEVYRRVAEPDGITSAELRFVNDIPLPEDSLSFPEYFNIYPALSEEFPADLSAFITGVEFPRMNGTALLMASLMSQVREKEVFIRFDLSFRTVSAAAVVLDESADWLERAHTEIEQCFEAGLTQKLKASFERIDE